ncbi:MAG: family 2 glycosyl transferase, partial [Bacteroidetes bacterium]|nr:family 2 glycosyl transferase [Bacteroidota bacterium]
KEKIRTVPSVNYLVLSAENLLVKSEELIYRMFRIGPVALIVAISLVFLSYRSIDHQNTAEISNQKELGGFFRGVYLDANDINNLNAFTRELSGGLDVVSIEQPMDTLSSVPMNLLTSISGANAIPMIKWMPLEENHQDLNGLFHKISLGEYDFYLQRLAQDFRKYGQPVFLSFAPGVDALDKNHDTYIKAWQYVYTFFNDVGVSNLTWVWCPSKASSAAYYPGDKFVDWIGVNCLNYAVSREAKDWYAFSELYAPYRNSYGKFQKPVMITEFGSAAGAHQKEWFTDALKSLRSDYKEIKSLVFYITKKEIRFSSQEAGKDFVYVADFNFNDPTLVASVNTELAKEAFAARPVLTHEPSVFAMSTGTSSSHAIKGTPGNYSMLVNGKPYYIKGVAYNTAHDWRDGNMPLTRRQVEKDFAKIKDMGANTIRRYDHGIYDKNILNIAAEYDLKVLYGFWFDPKVDYYRDSLKVKEYIQNVEKKVLEFKDHPSVLAWSLGNETWGLLKHKYSKPYLTKVREHYVKMVELLARRIHELDPDRPVFSCMEHEKYQLAGEVVAFRDGAPSLDGIGVNSYYKEQISKLNHLAWQFDSLRPYIVSEFGPRGYWDPDYNKTVNGVLVEQSETEKAYWYKLQWSEYITSKKGYNIGGFAYCWHDRMEGSNTWFGLTDFKGRAKPSYYALKELWTGDKTELLPEFQISAPSSFIPGYEYTYKAKGEINDEDGLKFEWYLHKDEFLERVGNVEYVEDGRTVKVKIPEEASNYKLYLYVSDKEGKVTTASAPLQVKDIKK